jgi:hypothetical protein
MVKIIKITRQGFYLRTIRLGCATQKKIRKRRKGRERVLKLSSPSLHLNLKGINSIDLKSKKDKFFLPLFT